MFNLLNQSNIKQKIIIAIQPNHYTVANKILDLFINNNKEYLEIEYINVPYRKKGPFLILLLYLKNIHLFI